MKIFTLVALFIVPVVISNVNSNESSGSGENIGNRSGENIGNRPEENIGNRSEENIGNRSEENIESRSEENIGNRSEENIGSESEEINFGTNEEKDENMQSVCVNDWRLKFNETARRWREPMYYINNNYNAFENLCNIKLNKNTIEEFKLVQNRFYRNFEISGRNYLFKLAQFSSRSIMTS